MSNEDVDFVKTRTKPTVISSYWNYNHNVTEHLSKEQILALQNLRKNKDIVIQKSNKSNSVVFADKTDYEMENLLNDVLKGTLMQIWKSP